MITRYSVQLFLVFLCFQTLLQASCSAAETGQPIFAPALKPGDTIAVIVAASSPEEDQQTVKRIINKILSKGYRVRISPNLMTRYGYLAGTDTARAKAFMEAWQDPAVKALWCYRGGYGCVRILDRLDYRYIKEHPKILIGMSDITALHAAINKKTGLVTFLGPNVNGVFGKEERQGSLYNQKQLLEMISSSRPFGTQGHSYALPRSFPGKGECVMTLRAGVGRGRLAGGTLSLVTSLIGTPWEIETTGKILVLEEVDEEPYRIDRMLQQLKHSGKLEGLAGLVLCSWKACQGRRPDKTLSLDHVFREYFEDAPYPVLLGFPSGHITDQATLPLNALAELDASKKVLKLLENPVENRR